MEAYGEAVLQSNALPTALTSRQRLEAPRLQPRLKSVQYKAAEAGERNTELKTVKASLVP